MTGRIIEIAQDGRSVHLERGFLAVREDGETVGKVALDDVDAVLASAHGVMWSNRALAALSERGVPVVILGSDFTPASALLPVRGHHDQGRRMRAQAEATRPTRKRLWGEIVRAKIGAQADALEAIGRDALRLRNLRADVRSGDPDNREAVAAQVYWLMMMGEGFRRDRDARAVNAMLNYGYAVLRAGAARAIVAAGLHPALSVHHVSDGDALSLADDVMEPFRPAVDLIARSLDREGADMTQRETKAALVAVLAADIRTEAGRTPLSQVMVRACQNMAASFMRSGGTKDWGMGLPPSCLPVSPELDL
jgi:CRISPR-associated protein Cas1